MGNRAVSDRDISAKGIEKSSVSARVGSYLFTAAGISLTVTYANSHAVSALNTFIPEIRCWKRSAQRIQHGDRIDDFLRDRTGDGRQDAGGCKCHSDDA